MSAPLLINPPSPVADGEALPIISDHVLIRRIGKGAYGEVWLARNVIGGFPAVKVVYRKTFSENRPFEREFKGICKFEPISRTHPGLVTILQVGENLAAGYFYYVMELADDVRTGQKIDADNYQAVEIRLILAANFFSCVSNASLVPPSARGRGAVPLIRRPPVGPRRSGGGLLARRQVFQFAVTISRRASRSRL